MDAEHRVVRAGPEPPNEPRASCVLFVLFK